MSADAIVHIHPSPALVSVVMPARNAAATIEDQLAALERQAYSGRWELIVADNGSDDTTRDILERWRDRLPALRIVDASRRPGPSFARNTGAGVAGGDFLAFCDADDVVGEEWLAALATAAREFDIVTGLEDASTLNSTDVQGWRSSRADGLPRGRFLPFAPTCNLGVWVDVFKQVGGFHEDYFASEDIEWSWRAQLSSFTLGFAPAAVVHYRYRTTAGKIARQGFSAGISTAVLYRDFRDRGLSRPPFARALRQWAWLVVRAPYLLSPSRRGLWVRRAAEAAGRIAGSVRCRVVAL